MRRHKAEKRKVQPEPKYNNVVLSKFINMMMLDGKKSKARGIVYGALEAAAKKLDKEPLEVFNKATENVRPALEVKSRRIGGATYQVPIEVSRERSISLAFRWLRDYSRGKKGSSLKDRLAQELIAAYNNQGAAVKKKEDTHKMAEANKAFSHYRW
ncbi:MAG: 30S ribosomal protein S7 [Candidatus Omnitrophica bacterium]|nr:30S ribosomal protein S7 [Candidatus Omnitrophota bacterium]